MRKLSLKPSGIYFKRFFFFLKLCLLAKKRVNFADTKPQKAATCVYHWKVTNLVLVSTPKPSKVCDPSEQNKTSGRRGETEPWQPSMHKATCACAAGFKINAK